MGKSIMLSLLVVMLCSFNSTSQEQTVFNQSNIEQFPTAFVINQHPSTFEVLNKEYSTLLLSACEEDMNKAYGTWKVLLNEISSFAFERDMDITGVKMWLKVFWSQDGQIQHIAYDLRPESKSVNKNELTTLLQEFVSSYDNSLTNSTSKFSHYGSVSYPKSSVATRPN